MKELIRCCSGLAVVVVTLFTVFEMCDSLKIIVPAEYTALAGDLEIHVQGLLSQNIVHHAQLLEYYPKDNSVTIVTSTPITFDYNSSAESRSVVWKARFRCGIITQGGRYAFRIHLNPSEHRNSANVLVSESNRSTDEEILSISKRQHVLIKEAQQMGENSFTVQLNVRWPTASLSLEPTEIETYPTESVTASVMFPTPYCEPAVGSVIPEMWITLVYCGHSILECKPDNKSHLFQVLYSEQIRGYPLLRTIPLHCQLFGQAGYYGLLLTTGIHGGGTLLAITHENAILKAKWSERFVFNVHARSIFRCDAHAGGVAVLFQYPDCILDNDRVRLFGRLRADVATLVPPTSLQYITEQKIQKGKHNLYFDCELFSEKYIEYCFVYVSQAITGAVSDVRMDCIPTFPVSDKDAGHWGSWSEWSQCTTSCKGGTRNRYRLCDSPPPKYGAKFCEGHALETEECGNDTSWECQLYSGLSPDLLAARQDVKEEVGPGCQCGCVIHLSASNSKRLLAASTKICPRKALWLIQAESDHVIRLHIDQARFPCSSQKLKVHDGEFVSSNLLAPLITGESTRSNFSVLSTGPYLLLELLSGDSMDGDHCSGGFLCHVQQLVRPFNVSGASYNGYNGMTLEAVHVAIIMILLVVLTMSLFMVIQYIERYHKYQRASINEEMTDTDISEICSKKDIIITSHETLTSILAADDAIPMRNLDKMKRVKLATDHCGQNEDDNLLNNNRGEQEGKDENGGGLNSKLSAKRKRNSAVQTSNCSLYSEVVFANNDINEEDGVQEPRTSVISIEQDDSKLFSNSTIEETLSDDPATSPTLKDVNSLSRRHSDDVQSSIASSISPTVSSRTAVSSAATSLKGWTLKKVKDLRNREKVLAGSEFSLTGQDTDLEMDYYDYNVHNTSAVPGSYLGMDPAYCVWIPPITSPDEEEGEQIVVTDEEEKECYPVSASDVKRMFSIDEDRSSAATVVEMLEMTELSSADSSTLIRRIKQQPLPQEDAEMNEKFQQECKGKQFRKSARISDGSGASTIVAQDDEPEQETSEEHLQIPIRPDFPFKVETALVMNNYQHRDRYTNEDEEKTNLLLGGGSSYVDETSLKFADDEDDDEDGGNQLIRPVENEQQADGIDEYVVVRNLSQSKIQPQNR